ncbi:SigE family RNA polymerase sigma factor [Actinomadura sp. HBU206391]|uniref:SigE family RNA polymerase sigma factor n=1 Tax=Actinomadura sp. HBU206391 TaxID=2731692 RepID=UPI0016505887|nr:SigE family RNA polymerase sigma factor [Actinomadura sp. HBU206391]MBC6460356.1 SigE family RNA polymerase sigma factor [Actinomadura sp. HBU206391]
MDTELVLIGRAADRPPDAVWAVVAELYEGHALRLTRMALVMVGDRPTAEDVVHEAFLGLYRRWPHLRDPERALAYVRSAVLNRCRNALRRRRVPFRAEHLPPIWSAEAEALVGEEQREVMNALHRLPARQREALVLRYFCDLSEAQTAETMRVSRGTVKSTTSRALTALGRILKEGQ